MVKTVVILITASGSASSFLQGEGFWCKGEGLYKIKTAGKKLLIAESYPRFIINLIQLHLDNSDNILSLRHCLDGAVADLIRCVKEHNCIVAL